MTGLLVSLLVVAAMAGASVTALSFDGGGTGPAVRLPSASGSAARPSAGGVVDEAADIAAQQNLDTASSVVEQAAVSAGYAHVTPAALQGVARQLTFTNGASPDDQQVSVAASSSPGTGSVTLALRSDSGTCFFIWTSSASTWFGTEPDAPSCAAAPLSAPPPPSSPGPGHLGWQQGSFPSGSG